jgi:predicted dehydrogenase
VPLVKEPYPGTEWGRGILDMATAIMEDRPHRATGAQAAHVVEILCAIAKSVETGEHVELTSTFSPPAMMDWAS